MLKELLKRGAYLIAPRWTASVAEGRWLRQEGRKLRRACDGAADLRTVVDLVLQNPFFRPEQKPAEILGLLNMVKELRPRRVCEIGTRRGGTFFMLAHVAAPDAKLLTIDLDLKPAAARAFRTFARPGQSIQCLAANSQLPATAERLTEWLAGDQLDFLLIDGDHSLAGVSSDYEMYKGFVRPGGLIAFHDIVPDSRTRHGIPTVSDVGQVPAFWAQLKGTVGETREFIQDPEQDGYGIGVIVCGR